MKILITLLLTLPISVLAKSKTQKYFELGTSLTASKKIIDSNVTERTFDIRATKGYIFNKHWDFNIGLSFTNDSTHKLAGLAGHKPKLYGARIGLKYIFNKRPGFIKHRYHKKWMTPYIGVSYEVGRFSPHASRVEMGPEDNKTTITVPGPIKTVQSGPVLSIGTRCFMRKNLAVILDLSYRKAKRISTLKTNKMEIANTKITTITPSISLAYFY